MLICSQAQQMLQREDWPAGLFEEEASPDLTPARRESSSLSHRANSAIDSAFGLITNGIQVGGIPQCLLWGTALFQGAVRNACVVACTCA